MHDKQSKQTVNFRALTAVISLICGLGLVPTGLANHIVAKYPMCLARHAWMSAHNILAILFVVFVTWHVILNRRALVLHLKGGSQKLPAISRELFIGGLMVAFMLLLAVGHAFIR